MRKAITGLVLALSVILPTLVAAPAEAHHLRTYLDTHTNTGEFHSGEAEYYAIKTKAMTRTGLGIRGKAALYLDGELQRVRLLKHGNILFRIYRDELRDNRYVTVTVRIFPRMAHRQDKVIRKEVIDTSRGMRVVAIARDQVGDPYRWAAGGPGSFDCSGLVQYAYRHATGIYLPHQSGLQARAGRQITRTQLRPGDLVYIPGHIAIYAGNGKVVEATPPRVRHVTMWQRGAKYIRILG